MDVVASLSQGRTAAAQCGLFTHKSAPVIFEPPCNSGILVFKGFIQVSVPYQNVSTVIPSLGFDATVVFL